MKRLFCLICVGVLVACGGGGDDGGAAPPPPPPAPAQNAPDSGAVYVFTRDAAGVWSQQAYLKASNTDAGDRFGRSIALSGDTLVVGADTEGSNATGIDGDQNNNSAAVAGAVYVFTRDGAGVWSQQAYIKPSNTDAGDRFGFSVALSGDTLVVGAIYEDGAATGINGVQSDNTANVAVAVDVVAGKPTGAAKLSSFNFGSDPENKDVIPVTVMGSVTFDATQVDFSTAKFGPGQASPVHGGHIDNVDDDDFLDMVFHFNTKDTGIACGNTNATLSGETFGGDVFTGTDSVKTAGCK